ncbi:hypothetical protein CLV98_11547 [Dyadobacter jejuensis]|uniref:Cytochrome C biogenesis DsbD-like protein n=1 Tax=Dyadobacter jejuensis TaxID=1082580 RepID=A0A316ACP6_9BACT|nr:hypothetical protein [Dyadobacter jejuensis]PWJ55028.1 hypothetical protein CLV98_11547 [Dyadobacter jejuensis]
MINVLLLDSLLLGIQHSFEPDHMAAVSVLASDKDRRPTERWKLIWRASHWALGHSASLIIFAVLVLLLKSTLSLEISEKVELLVGPLMIWLGIMAIRRNFQHPSTHFVGSRKMSKSFWVGMIHGLAGTGGACAVALTLAASDATTALWIIIIQSLGIIVSMSAYGYFFTSSLQRFASKKVTIIRMINYLVGAFSILIGIITLLQAQ